MDNMSGDVLIAICMIIALGQLLLYVIQTLRQGSAH